MSKKSVITLFLLIIFSSGLINSAGADCTVLTTTVPSSHYISVEAEDGGSINGLRGKSEFVFDRHSDAVFTIVPDTGYKIELVLYGDKDVTSHVQDSRLIIPSINSDGIIRVSFRHLSSGSVRTGDSQDILLWGAINTLSLVLLTFVLHKQKNLHN